MNILVLSLVLHITSCTAAVYNVTPSSRWTPHKPDSFLNTIKQIVSNTYLHFLQGTHKLYTDLRIYDVENISLTGELPKGARMPSTIHCVKSSVNIILRYITNLTLKNIRFKNCQTRYFGFDLKLHIPSKNWACILIHDCYHAYIQNVTLHYEYFEPVSTSFMVNNLLGNSFLANNYYKQ